MKKIKKKYVKGKRMREEGNRKNVQETCKRGKKLCVIGIEKRFFFGKSYDIAKSGGRPREF